MAIRILVSDPLSQEGIKLLEEEKDIRVDVKTKLPPEELKKIIKNYDGLIVRSETKVTKDIIKHADKLKVIGRAGIGLDNIDIKEASKKGIIVMNSPTGNTISTAEHAFSLMLAMARNIPQADASLKGGKWERKKFMGVELYGKVLGIIGLGRIGSEFAKRAVSFNMKVLAYDPFLSKEKAEEIGVESVDLKTLLSKADYITIHTPLTNETRNIINSDSIKLMKKSVRIVNCARGGIINEEDIVDAVEKGNIAGAAFDVFENEPPLGRRILTADKIITTPHLGASTEEAQVNVAIDIVKSVKDALLNKGIRNAINAPSVDPETLKSIRPYLELGEKLGLFQAQINEGYIKAVTITYAGDIVKLSLNAITLSIVKGLLSPVLEEKINSVNAMVIARERGINIVERMTKEISDFAHIIHVNVETNKTKNSVLGSLFMNNEPRIVKINDYYVEAIPRGYMLVIQNKDVPGIVGYIGTLMGDANVNIAGMTFGREKPGGDAVTLLNVDSEVSKELLDKIRKSKNIKTVKLIRL